MSRARFRGNRSLIATAVRKRKRTLYEISKAMGRRPGDIQRTVHQMHSEGLLLADAVEPVRGTLFWFNDVHAEELESALADNQPAGQITTEQRILTVAAPEDADPYLVLGRADLNGAVSWVVEWGGDGELLVGMLLGTPKLTVDRLVRALRNANISCVQRRVGELMDGQGLRRLTIGVSDVEEPIHT
jgi:hypothetical protein